MAITTFNALYGYGKYADGRTFQDFDGAFYYTGSDIDYKEGGSIPNYRSLGYSIGVPVAPWQVYRTAIISNNLPDEEVISAYIKGFGVECFNGGYVSGWIVNMEGHALNDNLMYGKIRTVPYDDPDKIVGTFSAPAVNDSNAVWLGEFNERGIALLESKRGSNVRLGFLGTVFPSAIDPPNWTYALCKMAFASSSLKTEIWINANPGYISPFYIWIEGTNFAYTDAAYNKRLKEGALTGDADGDPYQAWIAGDYQYYTDYLGKVRRILGTLTGLTGKTPYQVSINTKSPMLGTHYCYIDNTGAERCFEGTAA